MKCALPLTNPRETQCKGMLMISIKWSPRRKHSKAPNHVLIGTLVYLFILMYPLEPLGILYVLL